ncbi:unnamed protein product [Paramecium primaurelia]|uniref:Ion transport domain-containing protein n=2 Tax=Paramecium primaurelia TaxID=5886 RepID=A0A8S1MCG2_PARPR|nr:unnamed protein product [Paramecium primaurelia]
MRASTKISSKRVTLTSELANRSLSLAQIYHVVKGKKERADFLKDSNKLKFSLQTYAFKNSSHPSNIFDDKGSEQSDDSFYLSSENISEDSILSVHVVDKYNKSDEGSSFKKSNNSLRLSKNDIDQHSIQMEGMNYQQNINEGEVQLQKIIKKYQKQMQRNPLQDPYYVQLKILRGYERLKFELTRYHDKNRFLQMRKRIVFLCYIFPIIINGLVKSIYFKLFMTTLIIFNVALFIYVKTNNRKDTDQIEQVITVFFLIEVSFRIIASGVILNRKSFFRSPLNIYDFTLVVLTTLNLYRPDIIILDLSPLRMITLLNYLGDVLKGLSIMLKALISSLKFLLEALIIVGLFSLFFGVFGVLLFQNLFNYRCQYENGDETEGWIQCNENICPDGMSCQYSDYTPKQPTSFNNIIYSLGQILRTITMDDWSWVMFFTMRIFNPWIWIYYLLIIFVGGFFGFNLVIAVLKTHYAEVAQETVQEEINQQIMARLKEKQENPERDLIQIFDVAVLKHIGIYKAYLSYKKQLTNPLYQSQSHPIEELSFENVKTKVRTLSGRQKTNEKNRNQKGFQAYLDQFSLKYLLLPRFKYLDKFKQMIKVSNYTDDQLEMKLISRLLENQFSQLSPYPNYDIYQSFSSGDDVLLAFIEKEKHKKIVDQNQLIKQCRQIKFKQVYSLIKVKPKQTMTSSKALIPMKQVRRKIKTSQIDQTNDEITKKHHNINREASIQVKMNNFKHCQTQSSFPFSVVSKRKIYVMIQEQYIDYEAVCEKINLKIPIMIDNSTSNEFKYRLLRKKELKKRLIEKKNWSGSDVLLLDILRANEFNEIKQKLNYQDHQIWLTGLKGKITTARKYCYILISSRFSQFFFDLIILFNFTFLSLQGIANPELISQIEDITTILLCLEQSFKLFSYPCRELLNYPSQILQLFIIILNFIELTLGDQITNSNLQSQKLIRGTKCLLFYRCLRYNKMASKIGQIASKTFESYIYLTVLMLMVIFMYALIGMEMYAGQFNQLETLGQLHSFDNILKSFMTIFNIMTNDDWYGVYVMGGEISYTFSVIYSYSMVIILNYCTYGLVLAILLDGFGKYLGNQEEEIMEKEELQTQQISANSEQHEITYDETIANSNQLQSKTQKISLISHLLVSIKSSYKSIQQKHQSIYQGIECQQSLYVFDKSNILRIIITKVVIKIYYQYFIDFVIYSSIIIFIIKTYNDFETNSSDMPDKLQFIANIIILTDFILNVIAKGLFLDPGSFLTNTWQIIDVIYIIANLIQYQFNNEIIKILLFMGYFRPMKLMYRITWLSQLRAALGQALLDILNVFITLVSVWLIFGVYGIILYEKQFGYCEDKMSFYVSYNDCIQSNKTWVNYKHNFDNITVAIPTLFTVSTFDGWGEILQVAENSQTSDTGPIPFNSYLYTYLYLIIFCFIGSMFFLSLFTGILFNSLKENQFKMENSQYTQVQREFMKITNILMSDFPLYSAPPKSKVRKISSKVVNNIHIQYFIYGCLILDLIILLLFNSEMSDNYFDIANYMHNSLTILYLIWIILLFLALGVNRYFDNYWRRFYLLLVLIGLVDLIANSITNWTHLYFKSHPGDQYYQLLRLFFSLRSLRIILIFQGLINIQRLLRVMVFAMPYLVKIFTILIITMVIFALFGCQLYGRIDSGQVMDDIINFTNFGNAMLALFKCASGDDWRTIMTDTMQHNPLCQEDDKYCGSAANQLFFILFMLLSNYVLLNLFVLGLIEQFEQFFQMQNSQIQTYVENIDKIKNTWCKYSQETQGMSMHFKFLCKFLIDIGQPLGVDKDSNLWDACKLSSQLKLQSDIHGYIQYNFLMYELFRRCFYNEVFKSGSQDSITQIKKFNKESQFRLMYYRKNKNLPRSNISPSATIQPNINLLHDYLNVLILFKTWEQFSKQLIEKVNQDQDYFTDQSVSIPGIIQNDYQQSQNHILQNNCESEIENEIISNASVSRHSVSINSQINRYNDLPIYKGSYDTSLQSENRDFPYFIKVNKQIELDE